MTRVRRRHLPDARHADFYEERFREFLRLDKGMMALLARPGG